MWFRNRGRSGVDVHGILQQDLEAWRMLGAQLGNTEKVHAYLQLRAENIKKVEAKGLDRF